MQKFTKFLLEKSERVERNTPLSFAEAAKILLKNYSRDELFKIIQKRFGLVRADRASPDKCYQSSPSKNIRVSPFSANNYYNLFFSNNEAWKKYPVRNKSLICGTNDEMVTGRQGTPFLLIPINPNADVGVCSDDDIWTSFPKLNASLDYFSQFISTFMFILVDHEPERFGKVPSDKSFPEFKEFLEKVSIEDLKKYAGDSTMFYKNYENKNFYEILTDIFNPDGNGFKVMPFKQFMGHARLPDLEVWLEEDCIMIPYNQKDMFINEI
jgi:hypothetical protein